MGVYLFVLISLVSSSCASGNYTIHDRAVTDSSQLQYTLTFSDQDLRNIKVHAFLPLKSDTLFMSSSMYEDLPDGWAGFVKNLLISDLNGRPLQADVIGKGKWKLREKRSSVQLDYSVSITHDAIHWKVSGAFARAYSIDNTIFFTGRTIFIAGKNNDDAGCLVNFKVPDQWNIISAYDNTPDAHTYFAPDLSVLWGNGNLVGSCEKRSIHIKDLQVDIGVSEKMIGGLPLFSSVLNKILVKYDSIMGGSPKGKFAIMVNENGYAFGGEAFSRSISMISPVPGADNQSRWGYLLAHELFHTWNGHSIQPAINTESEWFVEGFTEFMAISMEYQIGIFTVNEYIQQLTNYYHNYTDVHGTVSLKDAGTNKGQNYPLIYYGGMSIALMLDREIKQPTSNRKDFYTLMRKMYQDFGITNQPYSFEDIITAASAVAGKDLRYIFDRYVSGHEKIELQPYLEKLRAELAR